MLTDRAGCKPELDIRNRKLSLHVDGWNGLTHCERLHVIMINIDTWFVNSVPSSGVRHHMDVHFHFARRVTQTFRTLRNTSLTYQALTTTSRSCIEKECGPGLRSPG